MTRLAEIQGHIASMTGLLDVVGAMRSLAGMRVQEAQHALPGIRHYAESMGAAIGAALLLTPRPARPSAPDRMRRALVVFTAEHGFVGGFNERLIRAAQSEREGTLLVLGSRGAALALERGCRVAWSRPMPTRTASTLETIRRLTAELYARLARGEISHVEVIFGRYHQGGGPTIERHLVLPLDLESLPAAGQRQAPLHNLQPQALLEALVSEYVFALLTEATVESIASENAARFAAMESAHDNVSKKLEQLRQGARQARQTEITTELLDLVTGAEALGTRDNGDSSPARAQAIRTS